LPTNWQRIVAEHGHMVFRAAYRVLGHSADAEDVAQEVFLEAVSQSSAAQVHNWGGYLRKIAVFRALDRRRQRRPSVSLDEAKFAITFSSAHDEAVRRELAEHLRNLIAALPEPSNLLAAAGMQRKSDTATLNIVATNCPPSATSARS